MDNRTIAAIDFGSYKTSLCLVSVPQEGQPRVIYYAERPSMNCISKSYLVNEGKASQVVKSLLDDAQTALDCKITRLVASLPKYPIQVRTQSFKANCNSELGVQDADIEDLYKEVRNFSQPQDENSKIYDVRAINYSDSESYGISESDIKGRCVCEIEGNFLILSGNSSHADRISSVLTSAGTASGGNVISTMAAAETALKDDEKYCGVAFVDMGGATTSVVIYHKGVPVHYASIPFGADNITKDLVSTFNLDEDLADRIKKEYGYAFFQNIRNLEEKRYHISGSSEAGYFSNGELCKAIEARQKEIFDAILYEIEKSGYADKLRGGIVLCGGGALLKGCINLMEDMSGLDVRLAVAEKALEFADNCKDVSAYSDALSAIGIALNAVSERDMDCVEFNVRSENPNGELFPDDDVQANDPKKDDRNDKPVDGGGEPAYKEPKPKKPQKSGGLFKSLRDSVKSFYETTSLFTEDEMNGGASNSNNNNDNNDNNDDERV